MSKPDKKAIRIFTLKLAIAFNTKMLATVASGADPKTEARLAADKAELAKLMEERVAA